MNKKDKIQEDLEIAGYFKVVEFDGDVIFYIDEQLVTEFNGIDLKERWEKTDDKEIRSVSAKQIRLGFLTEGILEDAILLEIDKLQKSEKDLLFINWRYSTEFKRNDPALARIVELLNLTNNQFRRVWKKALTS